MTPEEAALILDEGLALHRSGQLAEAEECYRRVVDAEPGNADALHLLGVAGFKSGRTAEAIELITKAVERQPDNPQFLRNLARAFTHQDKPGDAIQCLKRVVEITPDDAAVHNNLGILYLDMGDTDAALKCYERALELDPEAEDVISNLGVLKKEAGDRDAAEALYRRLLAINPEDAETWFNLSGVRKFTTHDPDIEAMEEFLARPDLSPDKAMHLGFGLAKAYGDFDEHDRAFEHLAAANRLKRDRLDYDVAQDEERVERIIDVFDGDFFEARQEARTGVARTGIKQQEARTGVARTGTKQQEARTGIARTGSENGQGLGAQQPIFIIGMPRSGTTLAEQILASHSDVFGAGEKEFLAHVIRNSTTGGNWTEVIAALEGEDLRRLGQTYMELLSPLAPGASRITDKMPRNFFFAGVIAVALPEAKIVHCRRDAVDTCLSNFQHHFPSGQEFSYDQAELGRYYTLYARLMDHWRGVLGGRIFDLDYEALVEDPEPVMRGLLEFCGLDWQDACMDFHKTDRPVRTASASQVRQPIYTSAVKRWKRFEKQLAPLLDALGPLADRD